MVRRWPLLLVVIALSCNGAADQTPDAGTPDSGAKPPCIMNPTTHLEIINACTDADQIDKVPVLPLANADGTLPPVP